MSHQPNPGPTLLATWVTLINQANIEYLSGNYQQSWRTNKMLFTWLPLDCKEDCRMQKDKVDNEFKRLSKGTGYNYVIAQKTITTQLNNYLYEQIPLFAELVESSLEMRRWVHKEDNVAYPRSENRPHIGE